MAHQFVCTFPVPLSLYGPGVVKAIEWLATAPNRWMVNMTQEHCIALVPLQGHSVVIVNRIKNEPSAVP